MEPIYKLVQGQLSEINLFFHHSPVSGSPSFYEDASFYLRVWIFYFHEFNRFHGQRGFEMEFCVLNQTNRRRFNISSNSDSSTLLSSELFHFSVSFFVHSSNFCCSMRLFPVDQRRDRRPFCPYILSQNYFTPPMYVTRWNVRQLN